jgi:hypothetical protein
MRKHGAVHRVPRMVWRVHVYSRPARLAAWCEREVRNYQCRLPLPEEGDRRMDVSSLAAICRNCDRAMRVIGRGNCYLSRCKREGPTVVLRSFSQVSGRASDAPRPSTALSFRIDRLADPVFIPCPPASMNVCRFAEQERALSPEMQRWPVMNMIGRKPIYLFDRRLPKRSSAWIRLSDAQRSRPRRVRGSAALDNQGWRQDDRDWSDQDH